MPAPTVPNHPHATSRASYSRCRAYRYSLTRTWDHALPRLCVCMLNPSTATEHQNDPTVRRAIGFALSLGFGAIEVVNCFALRATNPKHLHTHPHPVAPNNSNANDLAIRRAARRAHTTIAAWGNHATLHDRHARVRALLPPHTLALALTAQGQPSHPLYLPGNAQPRPLSSPPR